MLNLPPPKNPPTFKRRCISLSVRMDARARQRAIDLCLGSFSRYVQHCIAKDLSSNPQPKESK